MIAGQDVSIRLNGWQRSARSKAGCGQFNVRRDDVPTLRMGLLMIPAIAAAFVPSETKDNLPQL
jgi:hypothetical protein